MTEQRLIDADEVICGMEEIMKSPWYNDDKMTRPVKKETLGIVKDLCVGKAKTVDAVPVVRCKDCIYYRQQRPDAWSDNTMRCDHPEIAFNVECYDAWLEVGPEDFCSRGERRDDDGADRD